MVGNEVESKKATALALLISQSDSKPRDNSLLYPISELWTNNKPYLKLGAESGPDTERTEIYDVEKRREIILRGCYFFNVPYQGNIMESHWPDDFISTLVEYKWKCSIMASYCGSSLKEYPRLVFFYDKNWAMFRVREGCIKNICLENLETK